MPDTATQSYKPQVLVDTKDFPESDWLEYRRRGIGGSDAASILGVSPFKTARDLYYDMCPLKHSSMCMISPYTENAPAALLISISLSSDTFMVFLLKLHYFQSA